MADMLRRAMRHGWNWTIGDSGLVWLWLPDRQARCLIAWTCSGRVERCNIMAL